MKPPVPEEVEVEEPEESSDDEAASEEDDTMLHRAAYEALIALAQYGASMLKRENGSETVPTGPEILAAVGR